MHYADGEKRYILAPKGLKVGDQVVSGPESDIKVGNCLPFTNIPLGTIVHNVELKIGKGGQMVRSAGASAQLMAKEGDYALFASAIRRTEKSTHFFAVQPSEPSATKIMKTLHSARPEETAGSAFVLLTAAFP